MAAYSAQEKQYYDQLFTVIDKDDAGVLPGQTALPFLLSSKLSQQTLGEIWALSDPDNNGFLTQEGWYKAARIIGWMQKGGKTQVEDSLAKTAGPYPTFVGQPPPPAQAPISAQNTGQRPPAPAPPGLPTLTAADRTKFTRIFVGCGPSNGLIAGEKARDVFVKSQLSYEKLGQIWNLADTQQRGSLDLPDFIIGMFLIQSCMANPSLNLPTTLPPGTYEQASGGRPPPPPVPSSPIARQNTGGSTPIQRQYTGGNPSMGILQPQRTGQSATGVPAGLGTPPRTSTMNTFSSPTTSAFSPARQMSMQPWDVSASEKSTSDGFFAQLDTQNKGVIEGEVAVPFMLQSQLDEGVLASIWDLADIRHEGKLTKDEFAVAMHLINSKLAGREIPATIPNSLIPPSLRQEFGAGAQEVLQAPSQNTVTKDLFDLDFDDSPTPAASLPMPSRQASVPPQPPQQQQQPQLQAFSAQNFMPPARQMSAQTTGQRQMSPVPTNQQAQSGFGMSPFAAQPAGDLLGDDSNEQSAPVPDNSAEIGNKQNQLSNTSRSVADLEKTRSDLESKAKTSAAELEELESKLSAAKAKHETETKAVSDLRIRVAQQTSQVKQLQTDVITAESDLSAMKSEKDELGQMLMKDKEEVRGLQKRMKEIEDEKTGLKLVLEKLKKESRQQKGMVSIAKKQVTTAEGSRDGVQAEIKEEERKRDEPEPESHSDLPSSALMGGAAAMAGGAAGAGLSREVSSPTPSGVFSPSTLSTAAAVPLPGTPNALSPVPTGTSQRSKNPFDMFRAAAASPPISSTTSRETAAEPTSPGFGTTAILGAGAAVGLAAGVVAAGASAVYSAAKEAVTGEEEPERAKEEQDPFGAEQKGEADPFGVPANNLAVTREPEEPEPRNLDTDPFGMPSMSPVKTSGTAPSAFDTDFESGFGDSFGASKAPVSADQGVPSAPVSAPTDFNSAFADFDEAPAAATAPEGPHVSAPATLSEANLEHQEVSSPVSMDDNEGFNTIPSGIPKSAIPAALRPDVERTTSTQAVAPTSMPGSPALAQHQTGNPLNEDVAPLPESRLHEGTADPYNVQEVEAGSSDEDEGPEDLDRPSYVGKGKGRAVDETLQNEAAPSTHDGTLAPPLPLGLTSSSPVGGVTTSETPFDTAEPSPKLRRSAPPPPVSRGGSIGIPSNTYGSGDDFDPFGSHAVSQSEPVQHIAASTGMSAHNQQPSSGFDDEDDFDFSDLPPAKVDPSAGVSSIPTAHDISSSAFDDEFANFDDEFTRPGEGSDNSQSTSTQFEMVSPVAPGTTSGGDSGNTVRAYDEWTPSGPRSGNNATIGTAPPGGAPATVGGAGTGSGFSFDDAFGNDFEPAPKSVPGHSQDPSGGYAPPSGPPPGTKNTGGGLAPPVPERRPSQPQGDDLDDVKRLCSMGFSRTLAIDALEANDYDFQKTLNVLLAA